jgi:hypothetical protein
MGDNTCRKCGLSGGQHIAGCPGLRGMVWDREKEELQLYDNQGRRIDGKNKDRR